MTLFKFTRDLLIPCLKAVNYLHKLFHHRCLSRYKYVFGNITTKSITVDIWQSSKYLSVYPIPLYFSIDQNLFKVDHWENKMRKKSSWLQNYSQFSINFCHKLYLHNFKFLCLRNWLINNNLITYRNVVKNDSKI